MVDDVTNNDMPGLRGEVLGIGKLYDRDDQMADLFHAYERCCVEPSRQRQQELVVITGPSGGKELSSCESRVFKYE